jgi:hypothetical protein
MSCCGKKREDLWVKGGPGSSESRGAAGPKIVFEYTGRTAMAVIGPASGMRYSFEGPGAQVEVDARDWRSLAAVPHLRKTIPADLGVPETVLGNGPQA